MEYINQFQKTVIEKAMSKIVKEQEAFIQRMIDKHCSWWQRLYIKLAIKFKWRVWFMESVFQNMPMEFNGNINEPSFKMTMIQKYGVKINGRTYWM